VAMPLLLLMVMFIFQVGVRAHAGHVAQAAANRAAATAAAYGSSATAGQTAGEQPSTPSAAECSPSRRSR
jgi:Flp pilus assembly protein TadG